MIHVWTIAPVFTLLDPTLARQTIGDPSSIDGPE
jgi:hypothetical protein